MGVGLSAVVWERKEYTLLVGFESMRPAVCWKV